MTSRILTVTTEYSEESRHEANWEGLSRELRDHSLMQVFREAMNAGIDLSKPMFFQTADLESNPHAMTRKIEARVVTEVYPKWQCRALYRFPSSALPTFYGADEKLPMVSENNYVEERCRLLRDHSEQSHQFHIEDTLVDIPDYQIGHRA